MKVFNETTQKLHTAMVVLGVLLVGTTQLHANVGVAIDGCRRKVKVYHGCGDPAVYEEKAVKYLIKHGSNPHNRCFGSDSDGFDGYYVLVTFKSYAGIWGAFYGKGRNYDEAKDDAIAIAKRKGGARPDTIQVRQKWFDPCLGRAGVPDQEFEIND